MPVGEPNSQTLASKKYQKKVGLIAKSYKIKKELADRFAEACNKAGVSQAAKISELMEQFIQSQEEQDDGKR